MIGGSPGRVTATDTVGRAVPVARWFGRRIPRGSRARHRREVGCEAMNTTVDARMRAHVPEVPKNAPMRGSSVISE